MVGCTQARSEKRVSKALTDLFIENYLPLYKSMRQWSDRKKRVTLPLFPGYIFIRADESERTKAFLVKEFVKFITFDGKPAILTAQEIETVKQLESLDAQAMDCSMIVPGVKVDIVSGHLNGLKGTLMRKDGQNRVVIEIKALRRVVSVSLPASCVRQTL
jgi:transcription antitermination factor NusG